MSPDRRTFLARLVLGITGGIAAGLAALTGGYLCVGAGRRGGGRWTPVTRFELLEPNQPLHVEYLEVVPDAWATIRWRKSVWLVRRPDGDVTAFDPHCTHLGCPYDWDPGRRVFACPCHGGAFDPEGRVLAGPPPRPLDRMEVQIANGRVLVGAVLRSTPA